MRLLLLRLLVLPLQLRDTFVHPLFRQLGAQGCPAIRLLSLCRSLEHAAHSGTPCCCSCCPSALALAMQLLLLLRALS